MRDGNHRWLGDKGLRNVTHCWKAMGRAQAYIRWDAVVIPGMKTCHRLVDW
jgi:hypothetical protein